MIQLSKAFSLVCAAVIMQSSLVARAEPGVTNDAVTVGMSAPFTGGQARFGLELKEGAELYLRYVNEHGGIHGRQVQLIALDDANDPSFTVRNTKSLVDSGRVITLMSYYSATSTQAILPLLNDTNTPLVGVANGSESLRVPLHRYVFNLRASYFDEANAIVSQLDSQGLNKIAIFYQNDSTGVSALNGAKAAMARLGLNPTAVSSIEPGKQELGKAVVDIAKSSPQAVVVIAPAKTTVEFVRQMRNHGAYPQFMALSVLADDPLILQIKTEGRGLGLSQVIPNPSSMSLALTKEYLTLLKRNPSAVPSYYGLEGFIAAKVTVEAIRRAGKNPTRQKVVSALEGDFDIGDYFIRFAPNSRSGSQFVEMSVIGNSGRIVR